MINTHAARGQGHETSPDSTADIESSPGPSRLRFHRYGRCTSSMVFHDFCCRVTNRFVYVFSVVVATMSPQIRWCLSGFIVHYLKCIPLNKQQQSALRSAWAKIARTFDDLRIGEFG